MTGVIVVVVLTIIVTILAFTATVVFFIKAKLVATFTVITITIVIVMQSMVKMKNQCYHYLLKTFFKRLGLMSGFDCKLVTTVQSNYLQRHFILGEEQIFNLQN